MDKVYLKYKESLMNSQRLMDELGIDHEGDSLGMGIIRKEMDLNNDEKQYLLAVERGDVPSTRNFLNNLSVNGININCVDPLGRTALQVAIENENIEMIELLLTFNVEVGDALLHAINEENVEAVELILNHEVNTKGEEALHQLYPSSSFSPDITPIILAGHRDNYEIIKILLDRGFRIPKPHDVRCSCKDCLTESEEDSLRHSRSRINAYKALVSPSLIALSSKDPILTSFELSRELKRLSKMENEFKVDYEKLATRCQDFAVDLLEQTRGSRELQIILNHDTSSAATDEQGAEKTKLSRLKLAIKYKQKRFVSHPNCQQLLASLWYEGLPGFRRRNIVSKLMITQTIGIMFPVMSLIYLIAPKCSIGELIRKPFIKFIVHSASYLTFLFLLILVSQRVEILSENDSGNHDDKVKRELRGAPATTIEWMILAYVAGLMWAEIKQLWDDGAKEYVHDMWNILDFVTNSLYIATFTLRLLAYLQVQEERKNNDPAAQKQRKAWDAYDPNLIAEALFAAANIFSSLKLIYIFTVNPHLGPLQISLGRMIMDIMKFGCVYFLVLFSFACGLNHLYWYYATVHADECAADSNSTSCDRKFRSFANLFDILQTLYWSVYGLVDLEHAELQPKFNHQFTEFVGKLTFGTYSWIAFIVLLNMLIAMMSNSYQMIYILQTLYWSVFGLVDLDHAELRPKFNHEYTELVGKLMFGVYSWIALVVLLNMLIAMMSNSYQIIYSQADEEWKFARSKLWISYFEDSGTLPAPFNIIPSPKTFYYILVWFKNKLCACSKKQKRNRWQSIKKIVKKINEREIKYQAVMRDLIKRYIMQKQRGPQRGEGVTEDDVNELKQDISSFRFELLEILRSNGMKTPNPNQPKPTNRRLSRKRSQMSLDRLKRSLSMEPLHELSTSAGAANQTWKSSSFKRDTLSVDMAISQTPVHVPSVEVTSSRIIAETIPEEIERKRRESMKPAPGEFSEFVVGADEIKIETHLASPLEEEEDHGRLTGLEDKVHLRDDRPNSTESVMSAHRKDEGLGESFDQYSEVSDSLSRNGNLNTDTVPHTDDGMQPVTLSPTDSPSNSPARLGPTASEVLATICSSKRVTFM